MTLVNLPGGYLIAKSIALGDVNDDGMLDIVVGYSDYSNGLLVNNRGVGCFTIVNLPGEKMNTRVQSL